MASFRTHLTDVLNARASKRFTRPLGVALLSATLLGSVAVACGKDVSEGGEPQVTTGGGAGADSGEAGSSSTGGVEGDGGSKSTGGVPGAGGTLNSGGSPSSAGAGGMISEPECASGSFDDDDDDSTDCVMWSACAPGSYVAEQGSETADRECAPCAEGTFSLEDNAAECSSWTVCTAGEIVSAEGTATADRTCKGCETGTFSAEENAESCEAWSDCKAGTHVANTPSASVDRVCSDCESGTLTTGPNQSECQPFAACPAGTVQTEPGTSISEPVCKACSPGGFCPGGEAEAVSCGGDTWDHDADASTACADKTNCSAGQLVSSQGSATANRQCQDCADGSFSTGVNALSCTSWATCAKGSEIVNGGSKTTNRTCAPCVGSFTLAANTQDCTPWTVCADGYVEDVAGTTVSDRTCKVGNWTRQFGTAAIDNALAIAIDASGNAYISGFVTGALPGQTAVGGEDVFVRKYSLTGTELWTKQFGTAGNDNGISIAVYGSSVYVLGRVSGALPSETAAGGSDIFLRKYDTSGNELWTDQLGTAGVDSPTDLAVDANGDVYVVGSVGGALPSQTLVGGSDAFVRKYLAAGTVAWTRQFGSTAADMAQSVSVYSGGVYVGGFVSLALPSQVALGGNDAFVRLYDTAGTAVWTRQFGTAAADDAVATAVTASGELYIAGSTSGAMPGETSAGDGDIFVGKYDAAGNPQWVDQLGSSMLDNPTSIALDPAGNVLIGGTTFGALPGQTQVSGYDSVLLEYSPTGTRVWTSQFGTNNFDRIEDLVVDSAGDLFFAGAAYGAWPGQTSAGSQDAYVTRLLH